jgi:hypothetical protein
MNTENYTVGVNVLEAAGVGSPEERLYHIASVRKDGSILINDVWEPVEPIIYQVPNTIQG